MTHTPSTPALLFDRAEDATLVEQIVRAVASRIDDKLLRTGARMPSIRQFAGQHGVSRFTVVEAYDRLVAHGYLESRRGSGFYVRERRPQASAPARRAIDGPPQLDVVWLIRSMFRQHPQERMPGAGLLPDEWLDADLIGNALRAVGRQNQSAVLHYGDAHGYLPLRQQLQLMLAGHEIACEPQQIVTTNGITQALDLVARHFVRPGDVIFVDDPAWFLMFGSFSMLGAKVVGVPRLADGPDIAKLRELAALHKPRLFVINSVLHNPTSGSLSAANAFQVLRIAQEHDFLVVEDDVYGDLHPIKGATRVAALDQLERVIYLGSFSKTLAAGLRVGFLAASPDIARQLADRKILNTLTTSDVGERAVYRVLSEGQYRKHVDRLRARLDAVREPVLRKLERIGMRIDFMPAGGLFLWVDTGVDTNALTERGLQQGILFAPGCLFSPAQLPSTRTRINISALADPGIMKFLARERERA